MYRTVNELMNIASCGGGMTIDANNKSVDDLMNITACASDKSAHIIIKNVENLTTDQLMNIAACGKGCVIFDMVC